MAEQTPESTANLDDDTGFSGSESEPSMEDILASIRKIISDDGDPVPLDGPVLADPVKVGAVPAPEIVSQTTSPESDLDEDLLDIDSLMGDIDLNTSADVSPVAEPIALDADLEIPNVDLNTHVETLSVDEDGMDGLMDSLIGDFEADLASSEPEGPVSATVQQDVSGSDALEDDMDLVKSLMADLTDEDEVIEPSVDLSADASLEVSNELKASIDDDLTIPDIEEVDTDSSTDAVVASEDDLDAMEEDIFDSILDMTLDDEIAAFDADAELVDAAPSLADIAAAAESAAITKPAPIVAQSAIVATAASVIATSASDAENSDAPETALHEAVTQETSSASELTQTTPTHPEPAQPTPTPMETPMQSALRSDAILDDVTETATMSAFAELNQVVEDKAVFAERGPRIGDLVQDALRPMLKDWLDENLQGIVERAVAKEVKRIASGK